MSRGLCPGLMGGIIDRSEQIAGRAMFQVDWPGLDRSVRARASILSHLSDCQDPAWPF